MFAGRPATDYLSCRQLDRRLLGGRQHSALAAYTADATKSYRYALLPDEVSLSNPKLNAHYREAAITIPGLGLPDTDTTVTIPATRVVWGLTIMKSAANPGNVIKFLQLLFGAQGVALQTAAGPTPISPPVVSIKDSERLPLHYDRSCASSTETRELTGRCPFKARLG
jgi:hypothetical protein